MNRQLKWTAVMVLTLSAVSATVWGVSAQGSLTGRGVSGPAQFTEVALAKCDTLTAGDVIWVTLTEDGDVDEQVAAYPEDTTTITAYFEYSCVPKKTTLGITFSLDGETVYTDKDTLKVNKNKGGYAFSLSSQEDALTAGEWGVQFFNGKKLLTEGAVTVGGTGDGGEDGEATDTVKVTGVVKDKKTKKPIKGALVLVLVPGVTAKAWIDGGQSEDDVFAIAQTDGQGQFVLDKALTRNEVYTLIITAKKYKATASDKFTIGDDEEDPVSLEVFLSK